MFLSSFLSTLAALLVLVLGVVSAHGPRIDWVSGLDDCWEKCLQNTDDGCSSSKCICDASQDDDYLPPAVSCMVKKCEADDWSIGMALLLPLAPYCGVSGNPVPESVLSSAYASASATEEPTSTRKPNHSNPKPTSKHEEDDEVTKIVTTTLTTTTTDRDGNTLQIAVPIVIGPNSLSSGKPVTSTIEAEETSSADYPSSTPASPSPTPEAPASTNAPQPQAESTTAESKPTDRVSNSNGSPFENMQAGASQWGVSCLVVSLGLLAGCFLRM